MLDPQAKPPGGRDAFVTHAHYDHSRAFDFPTPTKHSTRETLDLVGVYGKRDANWKPVYLGQTLRIGDLDVIAHNAGHVLGSVMYEVVAPEGSILYTGDVNLVNSHTMSAAEAVECDILVIEATFGLPCFVFPPQQRVALNMVQWAIDTLKEKRIPAFQTDVLGNAQEIISIFNRLTKIPVAAHWKVSRINRVYEAHGHKLEYTNYSSKEDLGVHVFVAPKGSNLNRHHKFSPALASGWVLWSGEGEKAFPLSDHADFPHLLEFVEACKPKTVLTCMGGRFNKTFAKQVAKHLKIEARPLDHTPARMPGSKFFFVSLFNFV